MERDRIQSHRPDVRPQVAASRVSQTPAHRPRTLRPGSVAPQAPTLRCVGAAASRLVTPRTRRTRDCRAEKSTAPAPRVAPPYLEARALRFSVLHDRGERRLFVMSFNHDNLQRRPLSRVRGAAHPREAVWRHRLLHGQASLAQSCQAVPPPRCLAHNSRSPSDLNADVSVSDTMKSNSTPQMLFCPSRLTPKYTHLRLSYD